MRKKLSKRNFQSLIYVKIFTFKDLWFFLLGIVFVSSISGSIGAFILGVSQEEFFLNDQDNIVIVSPPGVTTPFTGSVPLSLQSDILKISGVLVRPALPLYETALADVLDQTHPESAAREQYQ